MTELPLVAIVARLAVSGFNAIALNLSDSRLAKSGGIAGPALALIPIDPPRALQVTGAYAHGAVAPVPWPKG